LPPEVLSVTRDAPEPWAIARAARVLRAGGLVAFPTETVYGLGGDGLDEAAVARIFAAKGRPSTKGLILHLADAEAMEPLVAEVPAQARLLISRFTPGPLTIILRASELVPMAVRGGGETVALRWPDHAVARALIHVACRPVAAPSANLSGQAPPVDAEQVIANLGNRVDLVLDGGPTSLRVASTIVDLTVAPPRIVRAGAIPPEQVLSVLNRL
jgi:L-threonylcarbamoyladenylate synthase